MKDRYHLREDADGWTVFDRTTGLPAEVNGGPQVGLPDFDADDLVDLLNRLERERSAAKKH